MIKKKKVDVLDQVCSKIWFKAPIYFRLEYGLTYSCKQTAGFHSHKFA